MKTGFIGHRRLFAKDIDERLTNAIQAEIDNGCKTFTMGMHGDFDKLALSACRRRRHSCPDMEIEVVTTSLNAIKKDSEFKTAPYADVKTVMYEIEDTHYKQQITLSNRKMIDTCDTLICYVNTLQDKSGAKTALLYAEKRGLKIVNLYREEDNPFYGMTKEEIQKFWNKISAQISSCKK